MSVVGFDHVALAIPVGGEASAEAFFVGIFGMTRIPKPEPFASRGGAWFEAGFVQIHVGIEENFQPARKAHPALIITDLNELIQRLSAAGFIVSEGAELNGQIQRFVNDPFGNRIELLAARDSGR